MPTMAFITKEMLTWARERTFGGLDEAAKGLRVGKDRLEKWEKGESYPTFNQALDLAKRLKIPFGYLYLSSPPDESLPLPDLRVKPGTPPRKPSPDFLEVLYDAMRKQEWYREYLLNEGSDPVPFVGRYDLSAHVEDVAEDIRKTLGLTNKFRDQTRNNDEFFTKLVGKTERAGVLVIRSSIVGNNTRRSLDPDEFQGFAMSDNLTPLIFINQNDYMSAKIFTLMHELAHIWMGISGVSVEDYLKRSINNNELIQRRANEIAAETLVPKKDFLSRWFTYDDIDIGVNELQRYYRVSAFVILRRAFEVCDMPYEVYHSKYEELRSEIKPRQKGGGGGYQTLFSRNSNTITTSVINSVSEGKTLPTQASTLLNVRPATIYNMQAFLAEREKRA